MIQMDEWVHKTKRANYLSVLVVTYSTLTTKNRHYEVSVKIIFQGIKNYLVEQNCKMRCQWGILAA